MKLQYKWPLFTVVGFGSLFFFVVHEKVQFVDVPYYIEVTKIQERVVTKNVDCQNEAQSQLDELLKYGDVYVRFYRWHSPIGDGGPESWSADFESKGELNIKVGKRGRSMCEAVNSLYTRAKQFPLQEIKQ
jgi:hypothetical protein